MVCVYVYVRVCMFEPNQVRGCDASGVHTYVICVHTRVHTSTCKCDICAPADARMPCAAEGGARPSGARGTNRQNVLLSAFASTLNPRAITAVFEPRLRPRPGPQVRGQGLERVCLQGRSR